MRQIILLLALIICSSGLQSLNSQTVTVSKEIRVTNDFAYDILGQLEENILLFRDRGKEKMIELFDKDLTYKYDRELVFEKRKVNISGIVPMDTSFVVFYNYKADGITYLRARKYDAFISQTDTALIISEKRPAFSSRYKYTYSKDKSKSLIFEERKGNRLRFTAVDNDSLHVIYAKEVVFEGYDIKDDFRKIIISNSGEVFALFEKDNSSYRRDKHHLVLISLDDGEGYDLFHFDFKQTVSSGLEFEYDNANDRIAIAGLFNDKNKYAAKGYYYFSAPVNDLQERQTVKHVTFQLDFFADVYGQKVGREKELKDFTVNDLILRQDGGMLIITEMTKEYSRRSSLSGISRYGSNNYTGGWTDYYHEDIIIIALDGTGQEDWKSVLYKKQFSQDDDGIYSSYHLFKTPSRLRFIYNDEIKNSNTVSEYVMDPVGDYERNSVLNTDYQNLKLRFRDAVQISSNELIIPSEKNNNLSLVKVSF